jgi:DNA polymerase elongation subunit (family B)
MEKVQSENQRTEKLEGAMYRLQLSDVGGSCVACVFFRCKDGRVRELREPFKPWVYAVPKAEEGSMERLWQQAQSHPDTSSVDIEEMQVSVLDSGKSDVLKVRFDSLVGMQSFIRQSERLDAAKELAEGTVPPFLKYMLERRINFFTPLCVEVDGERTIRSFSEPDVAAEENSDIGIKLEGLALDVQVRDGEIGRIEVLSEKLGQPHIFSGTESKVISDFSGFLNFCSFQALFTYEGDTFLAVLGERMRKYSLAPLDLSGVIHIDIHEDIGRDYAVEKIESTSLDDIAAYYLKPGMNPSGSVIERVLELGKQRLISVMELSRACLCEPGLVSRTTAGMLNTYVHYETAYKRGLLVPDKKKLCEDVKTLAQLLDMDKSGAIYFPEPGLYTGVAKCDFSSMYPSIMVKRNVSPETIVNSGDEYYIDMNKKGLIGEGLERILERRLHCKRMSKTAVDPSARESYKIMNTALKSLLVCSFGYMGYSAFVFSKVECKEMINKISRQIMTRTKDIAEKHGLKVLYGYVDCIFVQGPEETAKEFCAEVSEEIGIDLAFEEYFRAIVFCPSKQRRKESVVNRYFGVTAKGNELEARGIALRRRDAPPVLKRMQAYLVHRMLDDAGCANDVVRNTEAVMGDLRQIIGAFLSCGDVREFAVRRRLMKDAWEYAASGRQTETLRAMKMMRMDEICGEVRFCYVNNTAARVFPLSKTKLQDLDMQKYAEKAADTVSELTGYW